MVINDRYKVLLSVFSTNEDLLELIDLVRLDEARIRELHYLRTTSYPENRDMLGKLKTDLHTVKVLGK